MQSPSQLHNNSPVHTRRPQIPVQKYAPSARHPKKSEDSTANNLDSALEKLRELLLTDKEGDKLKLSTRFTQDTEEAAQSPTDMDLSEHSQLNSPDTFSRESQISSPDLMPEDLPQDQLDIPSFRRSAAPTPPSIKPVTPISLDNTEDMEIDVESPIERPQAPFKLDSKVDEDSPKKRKRANSDTIIEAPKVRRNHLQSASIHRLLQQQRDEE